MASEDTCQKSISEAQAKIANDTALPRRHKPHRGRKAAPHRNTGAYIRHRLRPLLRPEDMTCDNVTWAVRRAVERSKQYLTLEMRQSLNDIVLSVNAVLRRAVEAAGSEVRFIDCDARVVLFRGRYCEAGIHEPGPNRSGLVFYEWSTVDRGENRSSLQNSTGDGLVCRNLRHHPSKFGSALPVPWFASCRLIRQTYKTSAISFDTITVAHSQHLHTKSNNIPEASGYAHYQPQCHQNAKVPVPC